MNQRNDTTTITDSNGTTAVRHTWPVDLAAEALAQFIEQTPNGYTQPRHLVDATGEPVAVIVSPERLAEGDSAVHTLDRASATGPNLHPTAYRPHVDGINADHSGNGALPYDQFKPILESAARAFAGLGKDDPLPEKIRNVDTSDLITIYAIQCAIEVSLDADTHGVIPVLTEWRGNEGAEAEQRWALVYKTPVPGLYLRGGPSFFGDDFDVIAANGWKMLGGFNSRQLGEEFIAALAEALPGVDWRTAEMSSITSAMKSTIMETLKAHGRWSVSS